MSFWGTTRWSGLPPQERTLQSFVSLKSFRMSFKMSFWYHLYVYYYYHYFIVIYFNHLPIIVIICWTLVLLLDSLSLHFRSLEHIVRQRLPRAGLRRPGGESLPGGDEESWETTRQGALSIRSLHGILSIILKYLLDILLCLCPIYTHLFPIYSCDYNVYIYLFIIFVCPIVLFEALSIPFPFLKGITRRRRT